MAVSPFPPPPMHKVSLRAFPSLRTVHLRWGCLFKTPSFNVISIWRALGFRIRVVWYLWWPSLQGLYLERERRLKSHLGMAAKPKPQSLHGHGPSEPRFFTGKTRGLESWSNGAFLLLITKPEVERIAVVEAPVGVRALSSSSLQGDLCCLYYWPANDHNNPQTMHFPPHWCQACSMTCFGQWERKRCWKKRKRCWEWVWMIKTAWHSWDLRCQQYVHEAMIFILVGEDI